jgi:hypothetical protein
MVEVMAPERQLVVAVEGTAALGPYWPAIAAEYVEKIVRSFCSADQKLAAVPPELALVVFHTHGPYSALLCNAVVGQKIWMLFCHGYQEYRLVAEASVKLLFARVFPKR